MSTQSSGQHLTVSYNRVITWFLLTNAQPINVIGCIAAKSSRYIGFSHTKNTKDKKKLDDNVKNEYKKKIQRMKNTKNEKWMGWNEVRTKKTSGEIRPAKIP